MFDVKQFVASLERISNIASPELLKQIMDSVHLVREDMPGLKYFEKAQNIINNDGIDPRVYNDKPYLVTTQNQGYLNTTLPQNVNSACIILGAGDTVFELASRGINEIVALDINELQLLVYALKKASILTLSAKDYESFLIDPDNNRYLSNKLFDSIKSGFSSDEVEAYHFWQKIFEINPQEDIALLFKNLNQPISKIRFGLPYLRNKKGYYELREKLEQVKIQVYQKDVLSFLENTDLTFDYIDISNILLFFFQLGSNNNAGEFERRLQILKMIYNQKLNANGTFVFDYWFGFSPEDIHSHIPENAIQEVSTDIYRSIYDVLSSMFDVSTCYVQPIIDGIKDKSDTVLLTRKK